MEGDEQQPPYVAFVTTAFVEAEGVEDVDVDEDEEEEEEEEEEESSSLVLSSSKNRRFVVSSLHDVLPQRPSLCVGFHTYCGVTALQDNPLPLLQSHVGPVSQETYVLTAH